MSPPSRASTGTRASTGHAGEHGGGPKTVSYVFKGAYVDATTVDVAKGNNHVKKAGLAGGPVSFDLSSAKIVVGDVNGDGSADLADVAAGDKVVVKVRAPKGDPGSGPFVARQLVDQTSSDSATRRGEDERPARRGRAGGGRVGGLIARGSARPQSRRSESATSRPPASSSRTSASCS